MGCAQNFFRENSKDPGSDELIGAKPKFKLWVRFHSLNIAIDETQKLLARQKTRTGFSRDGSCYQWVSESPISTHGHCSGRDMDLGYQPLKHPLRFTMALIPCECDKTRTRLKLLLKYTSNLRKYKRFTVNLNRKHWTI